MSLHIDSLAGTYHLPENILHYITDELNAVLTILTSSFSLTMLQLLISSSVSQSEWPIIVCSVPVSVLPRPCIMTLLFIGGSVIAITLLAIQRCLCAAVLGYSK